MYISLGIVPLNFFFPSSSILRSKGTFIRALSLFYETPESTRCSADVWVTNNYGGINTNSQPGKSQQGHGLSANTILFAGDLHCSWLLELLLPNFSLPNVSEAIRSI